MKTIFFSHSAILKIIGAIFLMNVSFYKISSVLFKLKMKTFVLFNYLNYHYIFIKMHMLCFVTENNQYLANIFKQMLIKAKNI